MRDLRCAVNIGSAEKIYGSLFWSYLQESSSLCRVSQRAWASPSSSLDFFFAGPKKRTLCECSL